MFQRSVHIVAMMLYNRTRPFESFSGQVTLLMYYFPLDAFEIYLLLRKLSLEEWNRDIRF